MKILIGTKYITHLSKDGRVPCDCHKKCAIDFLWYAGWRVRLWRFLGINLLIWSQDGKQKVVCPAPTFEQSLKDK